MNKRVFIATSLDGYIADKDGGIDWLNSIPNPEGNDMGYSDFMDDIDALLMGRSTFDTVCAFDIPWPYSKLVYVLSATLKEVPEKLQGKVQIVNGPLKKILASLETEGIKDLYIDGGKTIQSFLQEDLIDDLIITTIPILLGGGSSLFGELDHPLNFACFDTQIFLNQVVQCRYRRLDR